MKGVDFMKSRSTFNYYEDYKQLTISELEVIKHHCSEKLSMLYHDMSKCISNDDKTKFDLLNNESINVHNELSACTILINHKENGVI